MNEDLAPFRDRVRAWLSAHVPLRAASLLPPVSGVREVTEQEFATARRRQAELSAAGLAGLTWPVEYGGAGLTAAHQREFDREAGEYDLGLDPFDVAVDLVGPTLLAHGTPEQRRRYLPRILDGRDLWCQLFSEPGAGSDLAAVATRADLRDDGWHIAGQKVWTSGGEHADRAILVARSDFSAPKHRGLTYFVVDMRAPGVTVRPLRQMTGSAHFAEVFLDDVVLPAEAVVGEVGAGWTVVRTTLGNERVAIGAAAGVTALQLLALVHASGAARPGRDGLLDAIVAIHVRAAALDALARRLAAAATDGATPGPEASIFKLEFAALQKAGNDLALRILGPDGLLAGPDAPVEGAWQTNLLTSPFLRIAGGTDEIQRNIIAERILALPADRDDGRALPFSQLARS